MLLSSALITLYSLVWLEPFLQDTLYGKDLVRQNLILDQILIKDPVEQVFDFYSYDGGAYFTAVIWHDDQQILTTFMTPVIEGSKWRLEGAYLVKNKKLHAIEAELRWENFKKTSKPVTWEMRLLGTLNINGQVLQIHEENFNDLKFEVDYRKPRSIWDRWKLRGNLRDTLLLPDLVVPLFE